MNNKYINLNEQDRFIDTDLLRNSYLHYEESLNSSAPNYISFPFEGLELGIVDSSVPEIAKAISSVLSRSLEDAKNKNGGYLPSEAVERVQTEIISPYGVANLWGTHGHRFVLSREVIPKSREIIASILVGRSKDTIFFLTGRYNNIKHSEVKSVVDLNQPNDNNPNQKWFDRFALPDLEVFKPKIYHQIANFVVDKAWRGQKWSRFFLENIVKYYSRDHINANNNKIEHSQHLLCGKGLWQIGDPPWLPKMKALGFYLRGGAESFFMEQDWAPLSPIYNDGKLISNIEYNQFYGLPNMYDNFNLAQTTEHLLERIPEVVKLSQNPKAKLQYFQAMYDFL